MPIKKFTVSSDPDVYEAWPDVVLTNGGKLISVFTECTRHTDRNESRLAIVESTDRGRSWSEKKYLTEKGTRYNYFNCARIKKLSDGTLAITCDKMTRTENDLYECKSSEIHLWLADSEGVEWRHEAVLPFVGIVPDRLCELKSGRLIIAAHFNGEQTGMLEQYLWYSDDRGRTWSDRVTVAASAEYNLCEVSLLETPDGKLLAFMRENSMVGEDILLTVSEDSGESWSEIKHTPIVAGHRPTAGYLSDGRIMVSYRFIPSRGMQNAFISLLSEEGLLSFNRSERIRTMPLDYDRNPVPDTGYTGWVEFPDGELYIVNYIKDDALKAQIRGYSLTLSDIELPKEMFDETNFF